VLRSVEKSLLCFHEFILLCENGFPDGALVIARNIFEQFIIISRFEIENKTDRDELIEKYCVDYEIQRSKNMKIMCKYAYDEDEYRKHDRLLCKLKNRYAVHKFDEYWWSGNGSCMSVNGKEG